jgi:hypothetical protein
MRTKKAGLLRKNNSVMGATLALLLGLLAPPVVGQEERTIQQQYDAAFLEMYQDIGNLDKTFHFAELAIATGDLEGAIAALERMLIIDPDLPQVRMQLGTLYFQLRSYAMALTYLNAVLAHTEVPADIKQGAQALVTQIDALTSPHRFSGTVVGGIRYQTNANGGPMTNNIRLLGGSAILDDKYTRQPDWDVSVAGQFSYIYDFETEPSKVLETRVSVYSSKQHKQSQVDTTLAELQFGPNVGLTPQPGHALNIRPYVLVNDMTLGKTFYIGLHGGTFTGFGGGLDLNYKTSMTSAWNLGGRYVDRDYDNAEEAGLKGPRTRLFAGKTFGLSSMTLGTVNLNAFNEDTDEASSAYWEYGLQGTIQHILGAPFSFTPQPWNASVTVGFYDKSYDEANPVVDASTVRKDETLRTSANLVIPLNFNISLLATAGYTDVRSNLPNSTNENWFSSISVMGQF